MKGRTRRDDLPGQGIHDGPAALLEPLTSSPPRHTGSPKR
jgi:hypothetical protein